MSESQSTYCNECWPFHNAEVQRLGGLIETYRRQVRILNGKHNAERADCSAALEALEEAQGLNLHMMCLLQQANAEGKVTVAIYKWLRGIKSPPLGWMGDRAEYAVAAIDAEEAREKEGK